MGIRVEWEAPDVNIIRMTIHQNWTWEEFNAAMHQLHDMIDSSSYSAVDYILDMRSGKLLPSNVLSRMRHVARFHHEKSRNMIVVGAGGLATALFSAMGRILPTRMAHIALSNDMEAAIELLNKKRAEAPA